LTQQHHTHSQPLISTKPSQHTSLDLTPHAPVPSLKPKQQLRELELLKRDHALMTAQLEQCERQHQQRYAALEKQMAAEAARANEDIARRDADIREFKARHKARKAKMLAEKEELYRQKELLAQ